MITQEHVNKVLRKAGPRYLKPVYREDWSLDNPTYGYCYVVSEALYHYVYPDSLSYVIKFPDGGTHWFIKNDNSIIDMTAEQFISGIPYEIAKRAAFLRGSIQTDRGYISKRGYIIAKQLGVFQNVTR